MTLRPSGDEAEIRALQADRSEYLGYVRLVGILQRNVQLADHIVSLPQQYTKKPLLAREESQ